MKNLKKIRGDASFRQFFRKKNKKYSSIIVVAKKEKFKNLLIYDAINRNLIENEILAPKLYNENYHKNFIEIEDFGNNTIFKILQKKNINKFNYFKRIINVLNKIQLIKVKKIKTFKKNFYVIPKYDKQVLFKEAYLFCDWYLKKNFSKNNKDKFKKRFKRIIKKLIFNLKLKNNVFVHRDFHVSNLMEVNNKIGIIDTQDALIGNKAYDLASLIDDVRLETSDRLKKKVFNFYLKRIKGPEKNKFKNDFEILSVLRNLKIIGIFSRLAIRDSKKKYLRLIPYAWKLIEMRVNKNEIFRDLRNLLKKKFYK